MNISFHCEILHNWSQLV